MGGEKNRQLEAQFASYRTDDDQFVCADCFSDPYIQEFIREHEQQEICSYCNLDKDEMECRAASANRVLEYIEECIFKKYTEAQNISMPHETRGFEADELVIELDILSDPDGGFGEELGFLFGRDDGKIWLPERFYDENYTKEIYVKSWSQFKKMVQHKSRFIFGQIIRDTTGMDHWEEQIDPYNILGWVHNMVSSFNLIAELPAETEMIRVRDDAKQLFTTLDELGTAPKEKAKYANRMSPSGIPMFYTSDNVDTAIKEVWNGKVGVKFSIATFKTDKPCLILDLCNLPVVPSIFKRGSTEDQIDALSFLRHFSRDISQPVAKSEREHIEYVPTQILAEYFRHIFRAKNGKCIMGIKYPSSHTDKPCYVMFWGHSDDVEINPEILNNWCSLVNLQHKEITDDARI